MTFEEMRAQLARDDAANLQTLPEEELREAIRLAPPERLPLLIAELRRRRGKSD